ncbi:MAG TPA: DUF4189 domain-containing protein [Xanthobacteraceae bacterium]|nr:DUF4189 domain-containing protein [Xanthobacteraceae bacterium]
MIAIARKLALAAAGVAFLVAAIGAANAAGALAVGTCGAYGYGFDFSKVADARAAALGKCTGGHCRVVGVIRKGCAAMAVDARNPCGAFGWALNSHLGNAENISMQRCSQFGGRQCMVRAWACDEKG